MADTSQRGLITVIFRPTEENNSAQYYYQILDHLLVSNVELPILAPYAANSSPTPVSLLNLSDVQQLELSSKLEVAEGWLLSKKLTLAIQRAPNGAGLSYPGVADYDLHFNHQLIVVRPEAGATADQVILGLIGPAMITLLAEQGIWVLHTSAIRLADRVICFSGPSGCGKSTLAAQLPQRLPGAVRIADDLLPLTVVENDIVCLPHYTQPSLPFDQQNQDQPSVLPVSSLYVLSPARDDQLQPIIQNQSLQLFTLIKQFMGTTLFSTRAKKRQLEFCSQLIDRLSVSTLSYPHNNSVFAEIATLLSQQARVKA